MTDNVIPLRPSGTPPDDPLLSLPECPVTSCGKCGKTCEEAGGWISTTGCMACLTENEQQLSMALCGESSRASVLADELERLLVAARAVVKAPFPRIVSGLRRVIEQIDDNERRVPLRTAAAKTEGKP